MKLRRRQQSTPDVEALGVIAEVYVTFVDSTAACARLVDLRMTGTPVADVRDEALAAARRVAYVSRGATAAILYAQLLERVSEALNPAAVLPALARLGYALVALAEEAPEPEALLTASELEGLGEQFGIEPWLERCRQLSGEGTQGE